MDVEVSQRYWEAITVIEAQELLKQMTIIGTPYMSKENSQKVHRDLHKQAYPKTHEGPPVGPQDLAAILGAGRLNG